MAEAARWEQPVAESERELIEKAQRGDREAAEALLVALEPLIWRTCRALLPPGEDVEAAVQEVMVKVLKGLRSFRGEGPLAPWVARIAVNHSRDLLRRHRILSFVPLTNPHDDEEDPGLLPLPAPDPDPERVLRAKQGVSRVVSLLQKLPSRQREVFVLRFFAHLDLPAIAEALGGVDVGTVKTHLHRALNRLRPYVLEAWP
ncbi:MAG: RNA polymerase sigma factor [Thermoanaerobaculum sp.]|nr:MAG: RNA polymerase sigma factor [Thermoanaerobaculum sp.]